MLTPEIFQLLAEQQPGAGGEIQLTDAIGKLNAIRPVLGFAFDGKRYDVGEKYGFIETTIEFALQRPELKARLLELFEQKLAEEKTGQ